MLSAVDSQTCECLQSWTWDHLNWPPSLLEKLEHLEMWNRLRSGCSVWVSWGWIGVRSRVFPAPASVVGVSRLQPGSMFQSRELGDGKEQSVQAHRSANTLPLLLLTWKQLLAKKWILCQQPKYGGGNVSESHSGHQLANAIHRCNTGSKTLAIIY